MSFSQVSKKSMCLCLLVGMYLVEDTAGGVFAVLPGHHDPDLLVQDFTKRWRRQGVVFDFRNCLLQVVEPEGLLRVGVVEHVALQVVVRGDQALVFLPLQGTHRVHLVFVVLGEGPE